MDIRSYGQMFSLISNVFDTRRSTEPVIETLPQKPPWPGRPVADPFPRRTPEECGIPSRYISAFLQALFDDKTLDMHNIMILRDGAVIAEGSFGVYDHNVWHVTHSECKSIVSLAVGMLIGEGRLGLDERVIDIFKSRATLLSQLTHKELTVRHLLTMSSGSSFFEAGAVTETDWVKGFVNSSQKSDPGKNFSYNSMNTYMLAAIICEITGESLMDYLRPRLWDPLQIQDVFWETCPMGIEKGGWGLYIHPEDIAKVGQLVLQKGKWKGEQLVFESFIRSATTAHTFPKDEACIFDYGFQMWVGRDVNSFLFNGMFGQNVIGFPDTGVLLISNAGNEETFQQSNYYKIAGEFFGKSFKPVCPLSPSVSGSARLSKTFDIMRGTPPANPISHLKRMKNLDEARKFSHTLDGKKYTLDSEGDSGGIGIMPLIVQAVQNNYTKSIKALRFVYSDAENLLSLQVEEGETEHVLPIDFTQPAITYLSFGGEPHRVGITALLSHDEDGNRVIKLRISFLEIASSRFIKLFFTGNGLRMKLWEQPGKRYILGMLKATGFMRATPKRGGIFGLSDAEYRRYRITSAMEPELFFTEA